MTIGITDDGFICMCGCHNYQCLHCAPCCDQTYVKYTQSEWDSIKYPTSMVLRTDESPPPTLMERLDAYKHRKHGIRVSVHDMPDTFDVRIDGLLYARWSKEWIKGLTDERRVHTIACMRGSLTEKEAVDAVAEMEAR